MGKKKRLNKLLPGRSENVKDGTCLKRKNYEQEKTTYFLTLHVREFNSIVRVKQILTQLGPDVEVVPLDIFLKLAGNKPTCKTNFLKEPFNPGGYGQKASAGRLLLRRR